MQQKWGAQLTSWGGGEYGISRGKHWVGERWGVEAAAKTRKWGRNVGEEKGGGATMMGLTRRGRWERSAAETTIWGGDRRREVEESVPGCGGGGGVDDRAEEARVWGLGWERRKRNGLYIYIIEEPCHYFKNYQNSALYNFITQNISCMYFAQNTYNKGCFSNFFPIKNKKTLVIYILKKVYYFNYKKKK